MKMTVMLLALLSSTVVCAAEPALKKEGKQAVKARKAAAAAPAVAAPGAAAAAPTERAARRAEIEHWISKYDGAELTSGQYRCPAPRIPAVSKHNEEIDAVEARVGKWEECYNAFVVNLNAANPLTQKIPADIAALMTPDEKEQSRLYLEEVHKRLSQDARVAAKLVLADFGVWRSATNAYIAEHNRIVKDAKAVGRRTD